MMPPPDRWHEVARVIAWALILAAFVQLRIVRRRRDEHQRRLDAIEERLERSRLELERRERLR